jgi:protein-S-isoprenylcysteine O-methyltransferase Ste14
MKSLENKIPPPLIMALFAVLMWGASQLGDDIRISGFVTGILIAVLVCVGLCFATAGVRSFKAAATTVNPLRPEKASSLVTSGVYQITRNPMYVGLAFLLLAWGVYLRSIWALLCVLAFMFYISRFQITPEERALQQLFGTEYERYKAKVRRWL